MSTETFLFTIRPARNTFPGDATPEEAEIVSRHFEYLKRGVEEGWVAMAGRTTTPDTHGIILYRADSFEAAESLAGSDPALQEGVFVGKLEPFRIALWDARAM